MEFITTLLVLSCALFTTAQKIAEEEPFWDVTQLLRKPQVDGRIIGGASAPIQLFPYQLSLRYNGRHICGASIISENYAVTAAHCIDRPPRKSTLSLRSGSSYLYIGGKEHRVANITIHPKFDEFTQDYDVAVIQVTKPFMMGARASPISLPESGFDLAVGTLTTVTGWGVTKEGKIGPSLTLQYVNVPVVSTEECAKDYIGYGNITPRMICAGYKEGLRDACQGDSGGPLVADGKLIGVVSWGAGCARPDLPGVYTLLSEPSLREWLKEITTL